MEDVGSMKGASAFFSCLKLLNWNCNYAVSKARKTTVLNGLDPYTQQLRIIVLFNEGTNLNPNMKQPLTVANKEQSISVTWIRELTLTIRKFLAWYISSPRNPLLALRGYGLGWNGDKWKYGLVYTRNHAGLYAMLTPHW